MARVYTVPQFNIRARVWFNAFPDDLSLWDGLPPIGPPHIDNLPCQLYVPRWRPNQWLHALGNSCFRSLLNSGMMELRYAFGEDLHVPWGVSEASVWSECPLIECPRLSGRYYVGCVQDNRHTGFPNQYTICLMAQIGPFTPGPPPTPIAPDLPLGLGLDVVIVPPARLVDLPLGLAGGAELPGLDVAAAIPLGLAGEAISFPTSPGRDLPLGLAGEADVFGTRSRPRGALGLAAGVLLAAYDVAAALGLAATNQELFRGGPRDAAVGLAATLGTLPPKYGPNSALGLAATATYKAVVKRNPCATIGAPIDITLTCTSAGGTLTGWVGKTVICSYNSGAGNWQGTLVKSGNSGTITASSVAGSVMNFNGSSGSNWTVSTALSNDVVTCGPPFSGNSNVHSVTEGVTTGNTTWSYSG